MVSIIGLNKPRKRSSPRHKGETRSPQVGDRTRRYPSGVGGAGSGAVIGLAEGGAAALGSCARVLNKEYPERTGEGTKLLPPAAHGSRPPADAHAEDGRGRECATHPDRTDLSIVCRGLNVSSCDATGGDKPSRIHSTILVCSTIAARDIDHHLFFWKPCPQESRAGVLGNIIPDMAEEGPDHLRRRNTPAVCVSREGKRSSFRVASQSGHNVRVFSKWEMERGRVKGGAGKVILGSDVGGGRGRRTKGAPSLQSEWRPTKGGYLNRSGIRRGRKKVGVLGDDRVSVEYWGLERRAHRL